MYCLMLLLQPPKSILAQLQLHPKNHEFTVSCCCCSLPSLSWPNSSSTQRITSLLSHVVVAASQVYPGPTPAPPKESRVYCLMLLLQPPKFILAQLQLHPKNHEFTVSCCCCSLPSLSWPNSSSTQRIRSVLSHVVAASQVYPGPTPAPPKESRVYCLMLLLQPPKSILAQLQLHPKNQECTVSCCCCSLPSLSWPNSSSTQRITSLLSHVVVAASQVYPGPTPAPPKESRVYCLMLLLQPPKSILAQLQLHPKNQSLLSHVVVAASQVYPGPTPAPPKESRVYCLMLLLQPPKSILAQLQLHPKNHEFTVSCCCCSLPSLSWPNSSSTQRITSLLSHVVVAASQVYPGPTPAPPKESGVYCLMLLLQPPKSILAQLQLHPKNHEFTVSCCCCSLPSLSWPNSSSTQRIRSVLSHVVVAASQVYPGPTPAPPKESEFTVSCCCCSLPSLSWPNSSSTQRIMSLLAHVVAASQVYPGPTPAPPKESRVYCLMLLLQPPKSILAQLQLHPKIPVHTISFNCADKDANEFLCQLAHETKGRFHYYSENGIDPEGPEPWEVRNGVIRHF